MPVRLLLLTVKYHSLNNKPFHTETARRAYILLSAIHYECALIINPDSVLSPLNMLPASSPVLINHLPRTHSPGIYFTYDSSHHHLLSTFLLGFSVSFPGTHPPYSNF